MTLQKTAAEQLLLNLVRLRYNEPPYFLEVGALNTAFQFSHNYGITSTFSGSTGGGPFTAAPGGNAGLTIAESPTVTYQPMQGEQFVQQLLSPINLSDVLMLYQSGWNIETILKVVIQNANGLVNAAEASGPSPASAPEFKDFDKVAHTLGELQAKNQLTVVLSKNEAGNSLVFAIRKPAQNWPQVVEMRKLLGVPENSEVLTFTTQLKDETAPVFVTTRSLMGVLAYLSKGVKVPDKDLLSGKVFVTKNANGGIFNWNEMLHDIFNVYTCECGVKNEKNNEMVRIDYRGHRFFIDDTDNATKSTFHMLTQLYMLEAGSVKTSAPVLTIPVGGTIAPPGH